MKRISVSIMVLIVGLVASFFPFVDAVADDTTCILRSDLGKVHVTVWDEDSGGDRQDKIFEGWLESGERRTINSTTGYINLSHRSADSDRSYGDNYTCKGGNTIRVP